MILGQRRTFLLRPTKHKESRNKWTALHQTKYPCSTKDLVSTIYRWEMDLEKLLPTFKMDKRQIFRTGLFCKQLISKYFRFQVLCSNCSIPLLQNEGSHRQHIEQGCQTYFHRGPHQPRSCLQRAECNFRTVQM